MSANTICARLSTMDSHNGNSNYQGCMPAAEAAQKNLLALHLWLYWGAKGHEVLTMFEIATRNKKAQSFSPPVEYQSLLDHSNTPKWNECCGTYHPSLAVWDYWHVQGKTKMKQKQPTCTVTSPKPLPVPVQNSDVCKQKNAVWKTWHMHRKSMKL